MPWRHPDSCITDKVPTNFNHNHVDQLKAHIVKLHDNLEGVLVRSGLSRVWRNSMCDPVLRRSDNTVMSIYDFFFMPSLDKVTVWEEPHGLDIFILARVIDRTASPAPAGTAIPRAFPEEITVTRPDRKVVTKADHAAKRKASNGPESEGGLDLFRPVRFGFVSSDMHTYVSRLKDTELETLIATYDIPLDLRPRLPDPNFRMINLPAGDTTIDLGLKTLEEEIFLDIPISEEPHELGTSILGRVAYRTTSPVPAGTDIPCASPEEIAVTRPDRNVVTKADHAAKRKASTGPEISTNVTKRTKSSKKGSGAGSSEQTARDEVEQTDDGTLDDDDQRDGPEFAMEGNESLHDVSPGEPINVIPLRTFDPSIGLDVIYPPILLPDKEVEPHQELPGGVRRTTRASFRAPYGKLVLARMRLLLLRRLCQLLILSPLDIDVGADDIASDGNVDSYFDARVSNTAGDVLERDLLPFVPGPYYIPYPFDEGSGSESPPYTRDDWEEIHGVNLGLRQKELYKDPKVCRTALDRFPTPAETHRLRELSSVELSDRMSVLQCQLITHGSMLNARYDHALKNESTVRANEEVSRLKAELGALKSKCEVTEQKLNSWDKKHRKYRNERDALALKKEKIEEELVGTKSQLEHRERQAEEIQGSIASFFQSDFTPLVRRFLKSSEFNRAFAGVLNTAISVGVERGLRMDRTDEEFRGLSQKVVGFIPDAKEKFDRVIAAFPDTTFPFLDKVSQHSHSSLQDIARLEPDRVTPSSQPSSATASLRTNTHVRHSTSSSRAFSHTSTQEHLKKKKKSVKEGGPSAA
ncbi:hypothetical protein Tco_0045491 [Tanacetum coccineum]